MRYTLKIAILLPDRATVTKNIVTFCCKTSENVLLSERAISSTDCTGEVSDKVDIVIS